MPAGILRKSAKRELIWGFTKVAAEEMPGIERRVEHHDRVEALRKRAALLGEALPTVCRRRHIRGRRQRRRLIDHRARDRNDGTVGCALHGVARGAVERWPLAAGALSEHVAQAQENEYGQRQEDDGVNIHVAFAF